MTPPVVPDTMKKLTARRQNRAVRKASGPVRPGRLRDCDSPCEDSLARHRLANEQRDSGESQNEGQRAKTGVRSPPTGNLDERLRNLRNHSGAEADARHGDAQREPAFTIESRRDGLRVDQRSLTGCPPTP